MAEARRAGRRRRAVALGLAVALGALAGSCATVPEPALEAEREATAPYRSAWIELQGETARRQPAALGTLAGDFHHAAESSTMGEARRRWDAFLDRYLPPDGMFEDSMHARLVRWAEGELERLALLERGELEAAARLTAEMREEDW